MKKLIPLFLVILGNLSAHSHTNVYVGGNVVVDVHHPHRYDHERVYVADGWYQPALVINTAPGYYYPGYVEGRPYYYYDPAYYYGY